MARESCTLQAAGAMGRCARSAVKDASCACTVLDQYDWPPRHFIAMHSRSTVQLEIRSADTGEVLFRDQLPKPVADISVVDLRGAGTKQVLVCLTDGEGRGYVTMDISGASKPMQHQRELKAQEQAWVR